jgi:hypothetical protein
VSSFNSVFVQHLTSKDGIALRAGRLWALQTLSVIVPEKYLKERKLQKLAYFLVVVTGIAGAFVFHAFALRIIFSAGMGAFSFALLHTVYLGIKYSLIKLTTGTYTKAEQPRQYYISLIVFSAAGLSFFTDGIQWINQFIASIGKRRINQRACYER